MKKKLKAILTASEVQILDEATNIHNNASLKDFYTNKKIDIGTRLLILFLFLFSTPSNKKKDVNKRIYVQNRALLLKLGYEVEGMHYDDPVYVNFRAALQSTLSRYEKAGFFKRVFHTATGEVVDCAEAHGLTDRYIILDVKKCKQVLSGLPTHAEALGFNKRSREVRVMHRRPLTLKNYLLNQIIKTTVSDFKEENKMINKYLEQQYRKYADFSGLEIDLGSVSDELKQALDTLGKLIYTGNPTILKQQLASGLSS